MPSVQTPELSRFDEPPPRIPLCPKCKTAKHVVRAGMRKTHSKGALQRYLCNSCKKQFSTEPGRTMFPFKVIAFALTYYNSGHTYEDTKIAIKRKMRTDVSLPALQSWTKRYADITTFSSLRRKYRIDSKTSITTKKLFHLQVYLFKFHALKLNIAAKAFPKIRDYVKDMAETDHSKIFERSITRCSNFKPPNPSTAQFRRIPANNATRMAEMAITMAKSRAQRHEAVEEFFIANDSSTFAVEVPVYIFPEEAPELNLKEPLTGHIDILQYRNNKIYVLDYIPEAEASRICSHREGIRGIAKQYRRKPDQDPAASAQQLYLYKLALSVRTGIPMQSIATAAFNENGYAEFG